MNILAQPQKYKATVDVDEEKAGDKSPRRRGREGEMAAPIGTEVDLGFPGSARVTSREPHHDRDFESVHNGGPTAFQVVVKIPNGEHR